MEVLKGKKNKTLINQIEDDTKNVKISYALRNN